MEKSGTPVARSADSEAMSSEQGKPKKP